ncbi:class I SAM-dependent methyltransferase [Azospirillum canadense]|uniref:class I SAM-dependent methyltransferase n=1 Tax=Azospirillum canadense TaxID=403962 RepID=UPI002226FD5F|nr:class I SAM-dependent methyltransferase [Azospirillum canadense]MCW2239903.1 ubiquinone/menaquinone biosynthesis C-methylase UbiE [Azospirillum canadense]
MRRMTLKEALVEVLDPKGRTVVDVGCGDGSLTRHFAGEGAQAIGIEISEDQLARARKADAVLGPVPGASYRVGRGEALPLDDASVDALVFSNSFHHLPLPVMSDALAEAARVLKPHGTLVVVEPIADGPYFEAVRPIEDETEVRAAAYDTLKHPPLPLEQTDETVYTTVVRHADADRFITHVVAVDPTRRDRLPAVEAEMRRRFAATGRTEPDGATAFDQPMRRMVFRRLP